MSAALNKSRVLVVDDGAALRNLLCGLLKNEGFNVVGDLAQGGGLLNLIERTKPHIVCLDYNLPDIDGMTLLKQTHQAYPTVAVVMITGSNDPELENQATEAGAAGFLLKPFTQQQIVQELQQVAHAQRLMEGLPQSQTPDSPVFEKRVVIADDSDALRRLLSMILTESGMKVVGEASNGQQAVDLTLQHEPDLVCLDVEMPVMSGLDALAYIRAHFPKMPVMMITSRTDKQTVQIAAKNGARGYILKPYQPGKVTEALKRLFAALQDN